MNNNDTKTLGSIYDSISGSSNPVLLKEDKQLDEYITEGLIDALGGSSNPSAINAARRIIGFVKRDVEGCGDNAVCLKQLEPKAKLILNLIINTIDNPMVIRTLDAYEDVSPVSRVVVLYKLLSR